MSDLIDRQKAIEALQKEIDKGKPPFNDTIGAVRCGVRLARNIIEDLPSAQPVAKDINVPFTDTISRQAAIDAVRDYLIGCQIEDGDYHADGIMYELDCLPSVQEQRWIPVTERLPEEDNCTGNGIQYSDDVLMTVVNAEDEETIIDYGHTVDGEWYSDITDCLIPNHWKVTAWMPLPEPYKERTDEKTD